MGSIPARAGEPLPVAATSIGKWVYPRACGGTTGGSNEQLAILGLSPRVRGNRIERHGTKIGNRVYPRACGGTLK